MVGFFRAAWGIGSFVTHAQSGLSGPVVHHFLSHPTFITSYLILMLGAPIYASFFHLVVGLLFPK